MEDIMFNLNDLERFCEIFQIPFDEEEIKTKYKKCEWPESRFDDLLDIITEDFSDYKWEATRSYMEMIKIFFDEIPDYEKEETKIKVHKIVKRMVSDLLKLQVSNINYDTDRPKEEVIDDRLVQIQNICFKGLSSCSKNLNNVYNLYYQASFDDIYSVLANIYNFDENYLVIRFNECDRVCTKDQYFSGYSLDDLKSYFLFIALMACSLYSKDTDISEAYNDDGKINGQKYGDCINDDSLIMIVKKLKDSKTMKKTR